MQKYVNTRLLRNSKFENAVEMTHHPDLTLEVLKAKPDTAWGFHNMTSHPNFSFEWVAEFPMRFWDWNKLSEMVDDIETIAKHPGLFWNWRILTERMTHTDMLKYPALPWDFNMLYIPEITDEHIPFFEEFKDFIPDWKWHRLAKCVRWSTFKKTMHLPWLWFIGDVDIKTVDFLPEDVDFIRAFEILCNWIKLTVVVHIDIINANTDLPWNRDYLQWNRTTWNTKTEPFEKCILDWVSANKIKRAWRRAISDPNYEMCRSRLCREFKELDTIHTSMAVNFFKLRPDAIIPSKATAGSIGLDLHSVEPYVVLPGQRVVVSTGLQVLLPNGVYGRIAPRSGLAVKHGLDVGAGVIDPDYSGEIRVVLFNHDENVPFIIRPGYRIAQLILEQALDIASVNEVSEPPHVDSERGAGGFGSTGTV
jgi:dUTP pyrophosphatase